VFSDDIYRQHCGASLQPILNTLTAIHQSGVWLEITHLLIPTINDDENLFRAMCQWLVSNDFAATPLHITRFFPLYRMKNLYPTPLATMRRFSDIAREEGITTVHLGNV
jgi:pyruvate formate lyase activating enzyme